MRAMHACSYHETIRVLNVQFASISAIFKYLVSIYSAFEWNIQINIKKRIRILFIQEKTVSDVLNWVTQSKRRPLRSWAYGYVMCRRLQTVNSIDKRCDCSAPEKHLIRPASGEYPLWFLPNVYFIVPPASQTVEQC